MEFSTFLQIVSKKRKIVFGIMALFLVIAIGVIITQRFKYSSKSQLLVVQEYSGLVDAYTASKSSEHLSSVLASVVSSNSFFTKVVTTSPSINTAYFGATPREQIREWGHTVKAQSINDSGIIALTVYHPNKAEAEKIAGAVNYVLMTEHSAYDGAGDAVKVRLIDQPVTSNFPVKPNVPLIILTALVLGGIFSLMYIYIISGSSVALSSSPHRISEIMEEDKFSQPPVPNEYPQYSPYSAKVTPYGQRMRVSVKGGEGQLSYPTTAFNKVSNIEEVIESGSMHNILG